MTSTAPTAVAAIIDDLSYAYDGVFDKEAVTDAVTSAWDLLSPRSSVRTYLPILVARQAREQLMAAAQADGRIAKIWPKVKVPGHAEEVLAAAQALSKSG